MHDKLHIDFSIKFKLEPLTVDWENRRDFFYKIDICIFLSEQNYKQKSSIFQDILSIPINT